MRRFGIAALLLLGCAAPVAAQAAKTMVNPDPERARFVTSDIDNFWRAYDLASAETDRAKRIAIFQTEYLDRGSVGLQDFLRLRIKSAEELVAAIDRLPRYYASIRPATLRVREMESRMRDTFRRFEALYPDAVFPDVFFLIGVSNTGGTASSNGLLIGTEMYGATPDTPGDELPDWMKGVVKTTEALPAIVAHESCHFNQKLGELKTLLAKSIQEGSCDFIGELISGETLNPRQQTYGDPRHAELWARFQAEMDGGSVANWMYNGATAGDRPADLGYYMGYRITRAFHDGAADKRQAIREILNVADFQDFLARSRYPQTLSR